MDGKIIDYAHWGGQLEKLRKTYRSGTPFPHIALERFVHDAFLKEALAQFPAPEESSVRYSHFNERRKFGYNDLNRLSQPVCDILREFNAPNFVAFLSELTGIPGLIPDPRLEGGGLHLILPGGFLNIHADFTTHHFQANWRRRCNVILYLNDDWDESWGGNLELWAKDMSRCEKTFAPIFNRLVVFNTDEFSHHGHPDPLRCPVGRSRKSIALYYYTEDQTAAATAKSTNYRFRPQDPLGKKFLIRLDTFFVRIYSKSKRYFPQADKLLTRILKVVARDGTR